MEKVELIECLTYAEWIELRTAIHAIKSCMGE